MVFQSNLRYEKASATLKKVEEGVWVVQHTSTPQYSYFDPEKLPADITSQSPVSHPAPPAQDTNKTT